MFVIALPPLIWTAMVVMTPLTLHSSLSAVYNQVFATLSLKCGMSMSRVRSCKLRACWTKKGEFLQSPCLSLVLALSHHSFCVLTEWGVALKTLLPVAMYNLVLMPRRCLDLNAAVLRILLPVSTNCTECMQVSLSWSPLKRR